VLQIATHALRAEIASRRGDVKGAIADYERARALEDGLGYMEPPYWHAPIRHLLAATLLDAGRAPDAERLYREDLKRFPENGWSLFGLSQSLAAQGRAREAADVKARFARAFAGADVKLAASHH
jgi:tetratricopeptide (TPR) repeat protein